MEGLFAQTWDQVLMIHINSTKFTSIYVDLHWSTSIYIDLSQFTLIDWYIDLLEFITIYVNLRGLTLMHINLCEFTSIWIISYWFMSVDLRLFLSRDSQDDGPNKQKKQDTQTTTHPWWYHKGEPVAESGRPSARPHCGWVFLYLFCCFCIFGPSSWPCLDIIKRQLT
jgi:hypothetical protein